MKRYTTLENKVLGSDRFSSKFFQIFKEILLIFFQVSKESNRNRNLYKQFLLRPKLPRYKTRGTTNKEYYRPSLQINIDMRILNKILINQIQQYIKEVTCYNHMGFIPRKQGRFNIHKSISTIQEKLKSYDYI